MDIWTLFLWMGRALIFLLLVSLTWRNRGEGKTVVATYVVAVVAWAFWGIFAGIARGSVGSEHNVIPVWIITVALATTDTIIARKQEDNGQQRADPRAPASS